MKPKEFWVNPQPHGNIFRVHNNHTAYSTPREGCLHVVEVSRVKQLEAALREVMSLASDPEAVRSTADSALRGGSLLK